MTPVATAPATSPLRAIWDQCRVGVRIAATTQEHQAPADWPEWLATLFPQAVSAPMAPHHGQFWEHVWAIDYPTAPRPFFGIWSREGGKSTNVELACVALGVRGARRYIVYVRKTQEAADTSVANIKEKLESAAIELYYPLHSRPMLSKFGTSRGWRRNRLRTAGGLTIDALGLDAGSIRGLKVGDDRPDLVVLDDIDDEDDTPMLTAKKRKRITTAVLPAAARDRAAVIGIQNLIIADGIFTTIVDGRADYLTTKIVSGPHPAVRGLEWTWADDPETGARVPKITGGTPTWVGQSLAVCERQMAIWGPTSFLREAQHQVKDRVEGLALNFDEREHLIDLTLEEIRGLVRLGQPFAGMDFGAWRFGFVLRAADTGGRAIRIGEIFSQREEAAVRAKRIHDLCELVGIVKGDRLVVPRFPIWGDAANPQDIIEMNAAWRRGWRHPRTGRHVTSPLRVIAVGPDGKLRKAAVTRMNDHLGARTLLYVRNVPVGVAKDGQAVYAGTESWLLNYNAGSGGTPTKGSRLTWELVHWAYPPPPEGKVDVKQDPDDHSADGADLIAADRYACMSWWKPGKERDDSDVSAFAKEMLEAQVEQTRVLKHRLARGKQKRLRPHEDY